MSDGITLRMPCCDSLGIHKQYKELKVKMFHKEAPNGEYDSSIPVYTCYKCGKTWAIERCV